VKVGTDGDKLVKIGTHWNTLGIMGRLFYVFYSVSILVEIRVFNFLCLVFYILKLHLCRE